MQLTKKAAQAAHAQDVLVAGPSRQSLLYTLNHAASSASASGQKRPAKPVDKFANYSSAAQLGLVEEGTAPSSYEVEQMIRNRETKVGQWEEIVNEPTGLHSAAGRASQEEDEEGEGWKFQHKGKRPVRDPYEDDDFDPSAVIKMRKRVKSEGKPNPQSPPPPALLASDREVDPKAMLDREAWSGKIDLDGGLSPKKKDGMVYQAGGGWVKLEDGPDGLPPVGNDIKADTSGDDVEHVNSAEVSDVKPDMVAHEAAVPTHNDIKPVVPNSEADLPFAASEATPADTAPTGLFKKRRPPPSSRKK